MRSSLQMAWNGSIVHSASESDPGNPGHDNRAGEATVPRAETLNARDESPETFSPSKLPPDVLGGIFRVTK
jgi:hypothetical protein